MPGATTLTENGVVSIRAWCYNGLCVSDPVYAANLTLLSSNRAQTHDSNASLSLSTEIKL